MSFVQTSENEFYVYLLSNNSSKLYPENNPSYFTNQLQIPLDFSHDDIRKWEVGLTELQIPKEYCNIDKGNDVFYVTFPDLDDLEFKPYLGEKRIETYKANLKENGKNRNKRQIEHDNSNIQIKKVKRATLFKPPQIFETKERKFKNFSTFLQNLNDLAYENIHEDIKTEFEFDEMRNQLIIRDKLNTRIGISQKFTVMLNKIGFPLNKLGKSLKVDTPIEDRPGVGELRIDFTKRLPLTETVIFHNYVAPFYFFRREVDMHGIVQTEEELEDYEINESYTPKFYIELEADIYDSVQQVFDKLNQKIATYRNKDNGEENVGDMKFNIFFDSKILQISDKALSKFTFEKGNETFWDYMGIKPSSKGFTNFLPEKEIPLKYEHPNALKNTNMGLFDPLIISRQNLNEFKSLMVSEYQFIKDPNEEDLKIDSQPAETSTPVIDSQPAETSTPVVDSQPTETSTPVGDSQPVETSKPTTIVDSQPVETSTPVVDTRSAETSTPVVVESRPAETSTPVVVESRPAETSTPVVVKSRPVETLTPVVVESQPVETSTPVVVESRPVETSTPVVVESRPVETSTPVVDSQPFETLTPVVDSQPDDTSSPVLDSHPVDFSPIHIISEPEKGINVPLFFTLFKDNKIVKKPKKTQKELEEEEWGKEEEEDYYEEEEEEEKEEKEKAKPTPLFAWHSRQRRDLTHTSSTYGELISSKAAKAIGVKKINGKEPLTFKNHLKHGYYPSLISIYEEIKAHLRVLSRDELPSKGEKKEKSLDKLLHMQVNRDGKIEIYISSEKFRILFDDGLSEMLGLSAYKNTWITNGDTFYFNNLYPVNFSGGINFLIVQSDIVDLTSIGNSSSRILRCVNSVGAGNVFGGRGMRDYDDHSHHQDHVVSYFPNTYYVPLAKTYIDHISIAIYTDFGQLVNFSYGKSLAVLHFRRKR